jgi:hypothetical protein
MNFAVDDLDNQQHVDQEENNSIHHALIDSTEHVDDIRSNNSESNGKKSNIFIRLIRKAYDFIKNDPKTALLLGIELSILISVFVSAYFVKKRESISALTPAQDCPTCSDCYSYDFAGSTAGNVLQMELLTPVVDNQGDNSFNYSFVRLRSEFLTGEILHMSKDDVANVFLDQESKYASTEFIIPTSTDSTTITTTVKAEVNVSTTDPNSVFLIKCYVDYGPGRDFSLFKNATGIISGTPGMKSMIIAQIVFIGATVTGSCNSYLAGNLVNSLTVSESVINTNIITCTTDTNAFTAISIALSYTLTTFSVMRLLHFIAALVMK